MEKKAEIIVVLRVEICKVDIHKVRDVYILQTLESMVSTSVSH
jgi:hypothetical protein